MKKTLYLSLILILFLAFDASAQFTAGKVFIGCNTNLNFTKYLSEKYSTSSIGGNGGLIIKDGMLVKAQFGYNSFATDGYSTRNILLGAGIRYYMVKSVFPDGFFGDTTIGYLISSVNSEGGDTPSTSLMQLSIGAGYDWFIHENIAIEPLLEYSTGLAEDSGSSLSFKMGILLAF